MCGIAGIWSLRREEVSEERLRKMTDAIVHRGPEGEGFWINTNHQLGFGHRRLAIIDLTEAGAQPMHYAGRYSITFNGEIYNYRELRSGLEARGRRFNSQTDTEVLLAAYAEYGESCLDHLDGMFAFAIWDEHEQTLFAARDRFGEKPFYYHLDPRQETFLFASEMKSLWSAGVERKPNHQMMLSYLALGYVQNPVNKSETFFQGISSLPPANCLTIRGAKAQVVLKKYYSLNIPRDVATRDGTPHQHFLELFTVSLSRRLRSDVPLGVSLSGGLDSSAIVAMVSRLALHTGASQLATFSAVFPGFQKDESRHIATMVKHNALRSYTIEPTAVELVNHFETVCYHQEEPFPSSSIFTQYQVYGLAKKHGVTVLLDGQGADETMAGYEKYIHWFLQELWLSGKKQALRHELTNFRQHSVAFDWSWKNKIAALFPLVTSKMLTSKAVKSVKAQQDLHPDYRYNFQDASRLIKPVIRSLQHMLLYNSCQFGLEELLRFADRNSMAHSREVRLPFLYHKLVEFLFTLPSSMKMQNGFTKYVLRQAMDGIVPRSICWRTDKIGFEPPQKRWMQEKAVQDYIHECRMSLISKGILKKEIALKRIQPQNAHAAENFDFRYMVAAKIL